MDFKAFLAERAGLTVVDAHYCADIDESVESRELLALEIGRRILHNYSDEPQIVAELDEGGWAIGGGSHVLLVQPPANPQIMVVEKKRKKRDDDEEDGEDAEDEENGEDEEECESAVVKVPAARISEFMDVARSLGIAEMDADVKLEDGHYLITLPVHYAQVVAEKVEEVTVSASVGGLVSGADFHSQYKAGGSQVGAHPVPGPQNKPNPETVRWMYRDDEAVANEGLAEAGELNDDPDKLKKAYAAGGGQVGGEPAPGPDKKPNPDHAHYQYDNEAVDEEKFKVGQGVYTPEGIPGVVKRITKSGVPGDEVRYVVRDKDGAEKSYAPDDLRPQRRVGESGGEAVDEKWGKETVVNPKEKGKYDGWSLKELEAAYNKLKKSGPHAKGSKEYGTMKELAFAIRAKTEWGGVGEAKKNGTNKKFREYNDKKINDTPGPRWGEDEELATVTVPTSAATDFASVVEGLGDDAETNVRFMGADEEGRLLVQMPVELARTLEGKLSGKGLTVSIGAGA